MPDKHASTRQTRGVAVPSYVLAVLEQPVLVRVGIVKTEVMRGFRNQIDFVAGLHRLQDV